MLTFSAHMLAAPARADFDPFVVSLPLVAGQPMDSLIYHPCLLDILLCVASLVLVKFPHRVLITR
jgi:hypothetical protein